MSKFQFYLPIVLFIMVVVALFTALIINPNGCLVYCGCTEECFNEIENNRRYTPGMPPGLRLF